MDARLGAGLLVHVLPHRPAPGPQVLISYEMFFHVEHHLYPAVPTCRLPVLARRLDAAAPELATRRVF
jgi:fatty acid desaturase